MSNPHAGDVAATFCATVVDQWVRGGLRHAVVSPGSRSTPLALAVAADDRVLVSVHHDERSAAFMALGIGMATGVPAMVVTTSGTAAVELHPAVVEAHHAGVPMLVCTADRPSWLHGVGAPQTINQTNLYGSAVRWFVQPGVPDINDQAQWRPLADRAMLAATGAQPGPVHLNLAFDEPLVGTTGPLPEPTDPFETSGMAPVREAAEGSEIDPAVVAHVAAAVVGRRGVIIAGGCVADPESVLALGSVLGWPVLADPRSGCRVPHQVAVAHPDALLRHGGFSQAARPEVVLRLGTPWASKVLGSWLDDLDAMQIGVHAHGQRYDPGGSLDELVDAEPGALCEALCTELSGAPLNAVAPMPNHGTQMAGEDGDGESPGVWLQLWVSADHTAARVISSQLDGDAPLSEPAVARTVAAALPDGARLVVSSSMPVRDLEWYSAVRTGMVVSSNRGANGIDGVVSTAVGAAVATAAPVVVLVGDVAMLHDTNALLGLADREVNLTVVVVDNNGGGIFSFLPQASALEPSQFEALFGTPHGVDLVALASAHNLQATGVADLRSLADAIITSTATPGTTVVVVGTDRHANVEVHDHLHQQIDEALTANGNGSEPS